MVLACCVLKRKIWAKTLFRFYSSTVLHQIALQAKNGLCCRIIHFILEMMLVIYFVHFWQSLHVFQTECNEPMFAAGEMLPNKSNKIHSFENRFQNEFGKKKYSLDYLPAPFSLIFSSINYLFFYLTIHLSVSPSCLWFLLLMHSKPDLCRSICHKFVVNRGFCGLKIHPRNKSRLEQGEILYLRNKHE